MLTTMHGQNHIKEVLSISNGCVILYGSTEINNLYISLITIVLLLLTGGSN